MPDMPDMFVVVTRSRDPRVDDEDPVLHHEWDLEVPLFKTLLAAKEWKARNENWFSMHGHVVPDFHIKELKDV